MCFPEKNAVLSVCLTQILLSFTNRISLLLLAPTANSIVFARVPNFRATNFTHFNAEVMQKQTGGDRVALGKLGTCHPNDLDAPEVTVD